MRQILQFIIFLSIFSSIYFLLNWFMISQVALYFNLEKNGLYWALLLLATFSFIIASIIENYMSNMLSKSIYFLATVWMGFLVIQSTLFFIAFTIHFINRHHLHLINPFPNIGYFYLGLGILVSVYSIGNACFIKTKKLTIQNKKIKKKIRIVHLSDLHLGPLHRYNFLDRVVKKVNALDPDYVMICGDLIDGPGYLPDDLLQGLKKITVPIFYSVGNHERYIGIENARRLLYNLNIHFLDNDSFETKELSIIGIEDSEDKLMVRKSLEKIKFNDKKPSILLYHRPDGLEDAQKVGIDLMLAGHTHAGQIFPFNLLVRLRFKRVSGLFEFRRTYLHVTSGTGTWGPPMRLGSKNEIAIIDILPA